jgi:hypothetical protein
LAHEEQAHLAPVVVDLEAVDLGVEAVEFPALLVEAVAVVEADLVAVVDSAEVAERLLILK